MKRLTFLFLLGGLAFADTASTFSAITNWLLGTCPANQVSVMVVLANGQRTCAQLPTGWSIVGGVLNVPNTSTGTYSGDEILSYTAGVTTVTLKDLPLSTQPFLLWRNGVNMTSPNDYSISGKTITFVAAETPQAGDIIKCQYWH